MNQINIHNSTNRHNPCKKFTINDKINISNFINLPYFMCPSRVMEVQHWCVKWTGSTMLRAWLHGALDVEKKVFLECTSMYPATWTGSVRKYQEPRFLPETVQNCWNHKVFLAFNTVSLVFIHWDTIQWNLIKKYFSACSDF